MKWADLSDQQQDDLTEWYNIRPEDMDDEDRQRLADLAGAGRFRAWNCAECGDRVRQGAPEDWGNFQGVQQPDFTSYPGDGERHTPEYLSWMCDSCRMGDVDRSGEGPEEWGNLDGEGMEQ